MDISHSKECMVYFKERDNLEDKNYGCKNLQMALKLLALIYFVVS